MNEQTRWVPLPDMYRSFDNPDTLRRYAAAYMKRWYPDWKPVKIRNYSVLAVREFHQREHSP